MTLISINIINWNSRGYVDLLLNSLPIITKRFKTEVVVVDRFSDDGSFELLREVADISIQGSWNRGEARQKALELCTGDVVINHIDTDEQIQPIAALIIDQYIKTLGNYALSTNGFLIAWSWIVKPIGYGSYHRGEDLHLLEKLYEKGKLRFLKGVKPTLHVRGNQPNHVGGPTYGRYLTKKHLLEVGIDLKDFLNREARLL